VAGSCGKVFQGSRSVFRITFHPLVAGLAGDMIVIAELREGEPLFGKIGDETYFLIHR